MADMTLEEALASATADDGSETEYCTVDDDTRLVTVPDKYKKLGVESDEKAKRIWFRFPKLVVNNGVDLSAIGVRVNFRNANGEGDIYVVEDLTTDGDYVTFSWELTRKVTAYKGNVSFVVCAVKSATDGTIKNEWNTTLNKECEVLEGLEVSEQIAQENPDIIEYILANLGGSVSSEEIANAVEEYMIAHPFTETDPTVPDWAKNPEKPSYTAEEVGALPNTTTTLPNPNTLTFTGAATGSYDGSSPVEINIPEGGGTGVTVDNTLSVAGKAADAKATGDAINSLSEEIGKQTGTGLSTEAIDKLEEVGNYLAYTTADGGSKWTELISILRNGSSGGGSGETVTLQSISATYTGGDVAVGTALTDLTGITVTATYSDGSTSNVTGYTLSGTIAEGSNTITVSYGGKTTTFTITGHTVVTNIIINGESYDVTTADGYNYLMVLNIGGSYYLYASTYPFYIYNNSGSYYEVGRYDDTYRATETDKVFDTLSKLQIPTIIYNGFGRQNSIRTLDQFVYCNHDLYEITESGIGDNILFAKTV